jgi:hypothetical protein
MWSRDETRASSVSLGAFTGVLQAATGLRQTRAIGAMLLCLVAGVVLLAIGTRLGGLVGTFLGGLLFAIAVATGVNAAGGLQLDAARGEEPRPIADALVFGLLCIPRLLLLGVLLLLVVAVVVLAVALLLLICKIPFLGPMVYVVVFPLSVFVMGVTIAGLAACLLLALPAIWEGLGVLRAVAQTLEIVRTRLVEALLLLLLVGLLAFAVGVVVFGILGAGMAPTVSLSMSILGDDGGGAIGSLVGAMQGNGYAIAAGVGFGVLWAGASTLVAQVWLLGLVIVYERVTEGIDLDATEDALRRGLDEARRRTAELGESAHALASRRPAPPMVTPEDPPSGEPPWAPTTTPEFAHPPAKAPPGAQAGSSARDASLLAPGGSMPLFPSSTMPPSGDSAAAAGEPPARVIHCPNCAASCSTEDLFCGVCGQRLR